MRPISRRTALQLLAAASAAAATGARASAPGVRVPAALSPLGRGAVELGGLLGRRVAANVERRLLSADAAALLECFTARDAADGLDRAWVGEHAGKFLDAACRSLGHAPRADLRRLVDRVATGLVASQAADGYLGTYPTDRRWSGWDVWVHKYTLIGLLSYHELSADAAALSACERIVALLAATFGDGPGQRDIVTAGEHMGMAATSVLEPVCRLYRLGGDPRVLEFGRYIVRAYDHPGRPGAGPLAARARQRLSDGERQGLRDAVEPRRSGRPVPPDRRRDAGAGRTGGVARHPREPEPFCHLCYRWCIARGRHGHAPNFV